MSAFKIGGSPFRPASEISSAKKLKAKETSHSAAPSRGGFDTASVNPNRLAVMPRMSTVSGESAQHVQGEAVEALLRGAAKELDDYFSSAYGFQE
ncbi:MAG: hypothetical protein E7425_12400 [Ruminococcaceae bacterium]|nr:hypothetical protein [Oscillospiraceae bacterium]